MPANPASVSARPPWLSYASLALVMLLWSGNSIIGRAVADDIPPFTLAHLRWAGASLLLLPFAWPHVREDRMLLGQHWRILLLLGLLGVGAFNALLYLALHYTTASNTLLMQAAIPPAVLLFDRLVFGQRAPALQLMGVLLSILGVVAIVTRGQPSQILHLGVNFGELLMLIAVLCWAAYTSLLRLRPPCHPLSFLAVTFLVGVVVMVPMAAWEWIDGERIVWSLPVMGAILYVAVLPSLVAYVLYNAAVRDLGPATAGQGILLMPLFGALLAAALLGEQLHGFHAVGMTLILGGILLSAWSLRRP